MMDHTQYEALTDTTHIFKSNVFGGHIMREEWFAKDKEDQILHEKVMSYLTTESEHDE